MQVANNYLTSVKWICSYYKSLGDKTLEQVHDQHIHVQYNQSSNSIAIIVEHMAGNMISRWTDFLTTDGEKEWRNRDNEFEVHSINKSALLIEWEKGWNCLFSSIDALTEEDLIKTVTIRKEPHTVIEAVNRQVGHLAYHIGQIVLIAKMLLDNKWGTLSIPKGQSKEFNTGNFLRKK